MPVLFAWDLHGTLLAGAEYDFIENCDRACAELKLKRSWGLRELLPRWGLPLGQVLRELFPRCSDGTIRRLGEALVHHHLRNPLVHARPTEHAHFVLQTIRNCGGLNLLVSNTRNGRVLESFVRAAGVAPLVDEIVGISPEQEHNGGAGKAAAVRVFAEARGCERIVLIGDHADDIAAGKAVGATTVLFRPGAGHSDSGADYVIGDLRKVLSFVPVQA